jgi:branched-chain amino acid transport system ATP-binding protein
MVKTIRELKADGLTVILSEQNLHFAALVSDRAYIIEKGLSAIPARWPNSPPIPR